MKNIVLCFSLLIFAASLAACSNTFDGAGRDIERAGEKIQDTF
ncbi:MAG: entericidin A/B family lipoprotein [Alphaproteobacteria bacterium]|nr:entericidin A/B family lipoprotein [Alphaproteobacteria bacterium]